MDEPPFSGDRQDTPPGGEWFAFKNLADGGPGRHAELRIQRTVNLKGRNEFNAIVGNFPARVDGGHWPNRAPRAVTASITGMR